ncbi:putative integral membrane protein [Flavobacterium gossypii]|uniref:Integral membrane protein n=1 Tax=Flavobacterium gossypii TaxID=1646119 RepID=A0ABR6DLZ4_9FLAO|nr:putative integral membrane protein [Flavobacterium gossypii]
MSGNRKLTELTIEELKIKQKRFRSFVSILSVVTLLALITFVYFAIKSNNYNFLVLLGGCSITLLLCITILKQVETEIKSRNSD